MDYKTDEQFKDTLKAIIEETNNLKEKDRVTWTDITNYTFHILRECNYLNMHLHYLANNELKILNDIIYNDLDK